MKFTPEDDLKRLIKLKYNDKEIYRWLVSMCTLNGIIGGILISGFLFTLINNL